MFLDVNALAVNVIIILFLDVNALAVNVINFLLDLKERHLNSTKLFLFMFLAVVVLNVEMIKIVNCYRVETRK